MKKVHATILALLALASAASVLWPLRLIQPFRPQTEGDVALAYRLFRWAPFVSLAALLLGVVTLAALFRQTPSWRWKAPALLGVLTLAGLAWAARVNVFQQSFAPVERAAFVAVSGAEQPAPEEMVIGISIAGEAKAYPVGMMAYHHVLNDELGGVHLAVTY